MLRHRGTPTTVKPYNRISGLNSAGSRVASATVTHRRCPDNGRDHHRLVGPQAMRHHVCAAPPALRLGRKSSQAMALAVFVWISGALARFCSLSARGNFGLSLTA